MDKRLLSASFRERFRTLVEAEKENLSGFLRETGIDRSALSQFLDPKHDRLPRAETLRRIAEARGVSVDWLLCLENAPEGRQEMSTSNQIESAHAEDGASSLARWHYEAEGFKLRYVPSTLPDMLSLSDQTVEERLSTDARGEGVENVLSGFVLEDRDIEIAMPVQTLEDLSFRSGLWRNAPADLCRRQLDHIANVCSEFYPALRLHLYDGTKVFSAPFTVFGKLRAAVYIGDAYLTLTNPDQVRIFAKRFDYLVRQAIVPPDRVQEAVAKLATEVRK